MTTVRNWGPSVARPPAVRDSCEARHRPIRGLVWQVFGGFVVVILTLTLAGAAQLSIKAGADDVEAVAERTGELADSLSAVREQLAELRAGQQHMSEDLRYIRNRLDEERKQ